MKNIDTSINLKLTLMFTLLQTHTLTVTLTPIIMLILMPTELICQCKVYCDYDSESYYRVGATPSAVLAQFIERWRTEVNADKI